MMISRTLEQAMTWEGYYEHVRQLAEAANDGQDLNRLNFQRMKRLYKQCALINGLQQEINHLSHDLLWLVLVEPWCGDGAQSLPVLAHMAESSDRIHLRIALRDEHPGVMDQFLTNGKRAMPKLVCLDAATYEVQGTWGPRPAAIQQQVDDFKAQYPQASKEELHKQLHLWYARDKGQALQQEFLQLLPVCGQQVEAA